MDVASILLVLAAAGQAGWAPERSAAPPPASAPIYDRYAQPPATGGVAPPPTVIDRTRTAVTESGATLRDGLEAGIEAASQQLQGLTGSAGRQLQTTGDNLRAAAEQTLGVGGNSRSQISNPFVTAPPAPAASSRSRGGLAPPPWAEPPATSAPDWNAESSETGPSLDRTAPRGLQPMQRETGWTSIGSNVAAPRLLVPALTTSARTTSPASAAASSGPSLTAPALGREPIHSVLGDSSPPAAPPARGADNWATGWGTSAPSPATISRAATDTSPGSTAGDTGLAAVQPTNAQPPDPQQQAAKSWADLWSDKDPWAEPQQTPRSGAPATQAATDTTTNNPASQPVVGPPANNGSPPVANLGAVQPGPSLSPAVGTLSPLSTTQQPPWLPLLVVSLSLAGSLGANLFLGWSYIDARQKYRTLVRKTADKFRRAATAAA
ncbi:MAG: hypothetical protein WD738_07990 [Pirellulales bacterium]